MDRYTLFCTEQQTKKAHNLGAPLRKFTDSDSLTDPHWITCNFGEYYTPTAEQMLGWLEDKGISISIEYEAHHLYYVSLAGLFGRIPLGGCTRKEATLAAIDAALEYLTNQKNK